MALTERPLRHPARDPTPCELAPIFTVSLSNLEYWYVCDTMSRSRRARRQLRRHHGEQGQGRKEQQEGCIQEPEGKAPG